MAIEELDFTEIIACASSDLRVFEPDQSAFFELADVQCISIYRGLGAAITMFTVVPTTMPGYKPGDNRQRRVWYLLPDSGRTIVCPTLFDLTQAIAKEAIECELGPDLRYTWWIPPNSNAHGDNKTNWVTGGTCVHNLASYIKYIQERGTI